ncbi:hypothetical protein AMECASPLE_033005, partial [Ameca splendens]
IDNDKSMTVDWDEFLHHVILNPVDNTGELVSSWKHSLVFDVGESHAMPIEFPDDVSGFGAWRMFVLSAGTKIQGLFPGLSGAERGWFAVDVAMQHCQCAKRDSTVHAAMSYLYTDEDLHPKQKPGDSDSAGALRVGLHLWSCGPCCFLPVRGIRDSSECFNVSVLFSGRMSTPY